MASVNRVYSALKDIANKDQRGFVSPAVFNSLAAVAQMNIYNRLFDEHAKVKRLRNAQLDGARDKSRFKQLNEDLAYFSKTATLSVNSDGVFVKPSDLGRIISASTIGKLLLGQINKTQVQMIYDESIMDNILLSDLSKPSESAPVGMVGQSIEVFPTSIKKISLRYYKIPEGINPTTSARVASSPKFGYTSVSGKEIYSGSNSVDFELPEHYFEELVIEIAKLIGINLRDQDVYNYSKAEETRIVNG
jgi:hypothetical protein